MKKTLIIIFSVLIPLIFSSVHAEIMDQAKTAKQEKHISLLDLFDSKCTSCHDAARSQALHNSGRAPHDVISRMQKKKGANISDPEAVSIEKFLKGPSFGILQTECVKCHNTYRIIEACRKGTVTNDTIKRMQKKGAKITDDQIDSIYDALK